MSTELFVAVGFLVFCAVLVRNIFKVFKGKTGSSQNYEEHVHDQHSEGWSPDHNNDD